jgi:hypothetical protein
VTDDEMNGYSEISPKAIRLAVLLAAAGLVSTGFAGVLSQERDYSGTWKLDAERSRVAAGAGLAGLVAAGAPDTLHITQPANGTLVVESQINESHARIYVPGSRRSAPVFVGPAGSITMTSRWEGATLVSEGRRESPSGTSTLVTEVKEVLALSSDGGTLTIEVTATAAEGTSTSTAVYTRTKDVGPCQSWPTPCKPASR